MIKEVVGLVIAFSLTNAGFAMTIKQGRIIDSELTVSGQMLSNLKDTSVNKPLKPLLTPLKNQQLKDKILLRTRLSEAKGSVAQDIQINGALEVFILNLNEQPITYYVSSSLCVSYDDCVRTRDTIVLEPKGEYAHQYNRSVIFHPYSDDTFNAELFVMVSRDELANVFMTSSNALVTVID